MHLRLRMATRMATVDDTLPLPIHTPAARGAFEGDAGENQVVMSFHHEAMSPRNATPPPAFARAPSPPRRSEQQWNALPAMVVGLVEAAAVWVGLAVFVIAIAMPLSDVARVWLLMIGSWLVAAGAVAAFATRPETA
jgi:hypothetical protein